MKFTNLSAALGESPRSDLLVTVGLTFGYLVNVKNGIVVDADEADDTDLTESGTEALLDTLKPESETASLITLSVSLIISPFSATFFFLGLPAATILALRFNSSSFFFLGSSGSMYIYSCSSSPVCSVMTIEFTVYFAASANFSYFSAIYYLIFVLRLFCLS